MIDNTTQDEERQLPCYDKLVFASREQAEAVAAVNAYRYSGAKLRAYACRHCHLWHLSSHYEE